MATKDLLAHVEALEAFRSRTWTVLEAIIAQSKKPHPSLVEIRDEIGAMLLTEDRSLLVPDEAVHLDVSDLTPAQVNPAVSALQEQIAAIESRMAQFGNQPMSSLDLVAKLKAIKSRL